MPWHCNTAWRITCQPSGDDSATPKQHAGCLDTHAFSAQHATYMPPTRTANVKVFVLNMPRLLQQHCTVVFTKYAQTACGHGTLVWGHMRMQQPLSAAQADVSRVLRQTSRVLEHARLAAGTTSRAYIPDIWPQFWTDMHCVGSAPLAVMLVGADSTVCCTCCGCRDSLSCRIKPRPAAVCAGSTWGSS